MPKFLTAKAMGLESHFKNPKDPQKDYIYNRCFYGELTNTPKIIISQAE